MEKIIENIHFLKIILLIFFSQIYIYLNIILIKQINFSNYSSRKFKKYKTKKIIFKQFLLMIHFYSKIFSKTGSNEIKFGEIISFLSCCAYIFFSIR